MIQEITAAQLKSWKDQGIAFQLIDIREEEEVRSGNIGGIHIPMNTILNRRNELDKNIPVIIHCNSGKRSNAVVYTLIYKFQMNNVYSLCGGLRAYAEEFDPAIFQEH